MTLRPSIPVETFRAPPPEGRRRRLTVLFADLSASSQLAERLADERFAALIHAVRDAARTCVDAYGGCIARLQGDGVLALFGHEQSRPDDGRRATEAALDLHAAVATLRFGEGLRRSALALHSGIHAGWLLMFDGDIERGRFDVVGEVANTAARLSMLAGPGELLVSVDALGPFARCFRTVAVGPLPIRGRSSPLDTWKVEGRAQG